MSNTTKTASEIRVGDEVVERDGALLTVTAVTPASRGRIALTLKSLGGRGPITATVRASAQVYVPDAQ